VGIFAEEIVTTDTLGRRTGPRMRHTIEEKLRIVEETRAKGASVAMVARLAGVNYFFRRRQLFLPVLSLHHWSTIAQSDARSVRSSGSEISARLRL